jgi:site-specific recombinase XerD
MTPSPISGGARAQRRRRRTTVFAESDPRRSPVTLPEYRLGRAPANAGKLYPAQVYAAREILALLDALPKQGRHRRTGVRDRALFTLLWRCGLRIGETLAMDVKDVDLESGIVSVLHAKFRKRRAVPIDRRAGEILSEWLVVRAELLGQRCDPAIASAAKGPLFCVLNRPTIGRRMGDAAARESMKYWAGKANWQHRAHPHALRHTFATELYFLDGAELADLQRALGHAHAATTDHYIHDKIPSPRLYRLMRDRPWPDPPPGGHAASPPRAA